MSHAPTPNKPLPALTAGLADFLADTPADAIPAEAVDIGRKSILDALGVCLSGSIAPGTRIVRDYFTGFGCANATSTVFGSSVRMPAPFAAMINGTASHADDYDDTLRSSAVATYHGSSHPTGPVITALLAVAERDGNSGRDVMTAYQFGVETTAKILDTIGGRHFAEGFHGTATCGVLGTTAALSRLFGFDAPMIRTAIGIAASLASGIRQNFGSDMKPFHSGHAAKNAIIAAELARAGHSATDIALESPVGFLKAFGSDYDTQFIPDRLGNPWAIVTPGVWIKPHPSGMRTHPAMTKILELIAEHGVTADQVETIWVRSHKGVYETLLHHRPKTGLQAKFSIEFCLSILLLNGKAGLAEFTDAVVNRPDVQAMIERVDYAAYPEEEARANDYSSVTTILKLILKDGRELGARADVPKGSTDLPMSYDEVGDKIRDCAAAAKWPLKKADALIENVARLETLENVTPITRALSE
ncbi:MAG: MmgE/PrpD family protein [Rhodospirillales bacterium]